MLEQAPRDEEEDQKLLRELELQNELLYSQKDTRSLTELKVKFIVTLISDPKLPYKVINVPQAAPVRAILKFIASEFRVPFGTSAIVTKNGFGICSSESASTIFLKYGNELKLIPRDRGA